MTLLELLRQELPKRGGWPEGVREISTHASGRVFFDGKFAPQGFILPTASDAWNKYKHPHSYTNAVTREQYEAALAAKNDGWIEWGGGEYPPVSTNTVVDVKLRCGSVTVRQPAGVMNWRSNSPDEPGDIIAYRLHQMQEAELNERIGQDAAPVWNGEGLPPVGCECERRTHGGVVTVVQIIAHFKNRAAMVAVYIPVEGDVKQVQQGIAGCFRPLRTEAERAIDEMVRLSGVSIGAAKILYDAGYRK